MSEIKYIPFEEESENIKERVTGYWTQRADSFFEQRQHELSSPKAMKWLDEIKKKIGEAFGDRDTTTPLRILDVGCGAGYFPVLLGKEGHEVTGVDLTEKMIDEAGKLIEMNGPYKNSVKAMVMDAEELDFEDESFDMVITRNLTWTLPHPVEAYKEWKRVLRKGGLLLNFDAEYAKGAHNLKTMDNLAHKNISDELKDECLAIYHMLTISSLDRPEWDTKILKELGYAEICIDLGFADRVFSEKDEFYMPDRMFMISARR